MQLIDDRTLGKGIRHLTKIDNSFAAVISQYGQPPLWLRPPGFPTLLLIILEQQVSLRSARAAYDRLEEKLGRITTGRFLKLSDRELKGIGFSRQKIEYCRELARHIENKTLDLEKLDQLETGEVIASLTIVKGIGLWTANIYLIMALRRSDIWPPGDLALRKAFAGLKNLSELPDDAMLTDIAEKWRPWRAVAARILWHYYLSGQQPNGRGE